MLSINKTRLFVGLIFQSIEKGGSVDFYTLPPNGDHILPNRDDFIYEVPDLVGLLVRASIEHRSADET